MKLHLALHEVISKSTQALRALNFPAGSDIENAKNIGWLATQGLPGLQILSAEIKASSRIPSRNQIEIQTNKDRVQFVSRKYSAFYFAQSAVDFAENGKEVIIKNCKFPLLIFAEMGRRQHLPFGFQLEWKSDKEIYKGYSMCGRSALSSTPTALSTATDLTLSATKQLVNFSPVINLAQAHPYDTIGVCVNSPHWKIICAAAKTVLIPDSPRSRSSAGAEVDDSF